MHSQLEQIVATHRAAAAADDRFVGELIEIAQQSPEPRQFRQVLEADRSLSLICEIKRKSPALGELKPELNPVSLANEYQAAGATCISVLTDNEFFGGSPEDLHAVSSAVSIPILRKDFTVSEADVVDARIMGADAVLLIVSVLDDGELWRFSKLAERLGIAALFEVHDEEDIERALRAEALMIGINQRNLHTFEVDNTLAIRLCDRLPAGVVKIAESGIKTGDDIKALAEAGFDGALVGGAVVTANSPALLVNELVEAGWR